MLFAFQIKMEWLRTCWACNCLFTYFTSTYQNIVLIRMKPGHQVGSLKYEGRIQKFLIVGGGGSQHRVFPKMSEVEGKFLEVNGNSYYCSPPIGGVWGDSPRKSLRFQAMKSAFWWILEMVLLRIMERAKNSSGLIGGSGPPRPSPWIRHRLIWFRRN